MDSVKLVPEARGHGLGVHVLARAIRTWADGEAVVALIAGPLGDEPGPVDYERDEIDPERLKIGETLARHWQQLGLKRLDPAVASSELPMPYARCDLRTFWETIETYSTDWESPEPLPSAD